MQKRPRRLALFILAAPCLTAHAESVVDTTAEAAVEEIVVTATRQADALRDYAGSITSFGEAGLRAINHQHVHELLTRAPGVWVSRGSGQEHLTAIRSPVLTGPGSCGAFLMLEDGIPIRPAGFCNVNQLFEAPTEIASRVEVVRGPGNALYGSNALHGTINVLLPDTDSPPEAAFEAGANDFLRARLRLPFGERRESVVALVAADDGGFRTDSGYEQAKLHAKTRGQFANGDLALAASATWLDQETAGFIFGEDAYRDPSLNRGNVNPEAFRQADAQRIYAIWSRETGDGRLDVRPYVRRSDMRFLQHFLPGQPLEENGHVSAGFLSMLSRDIGRGSVTYGFDLDIADVFLRQTQDGPTVGSAFLEETRPAGKHYDYDVRALAVAAYVQRAWSPGERWSIRGGLRAEYTHYDYANRMRSGNSRDDGTVCGFGGCLYTRPDDRSDQFLNLAPNLSIRYTLGDRTSTYLRLARGFRAPQMTELYRLQNGQSVADLDAEELDSVEVGLRHTSPNLSFELAAYAMQKRNSVFRDAEGFNVSDAESRHDGVEGRVNWAIVDALRLDVNLSYGRHRYDFDRVANRGETFVSGNDVDTAPRWLGSAEMVFTPALNWTFAAQVTGVSEYFVDAENRFDYDGHVIGNLRAQIALSTAVDLTLRLNNVTDRAYADRADFAFGNFRYFPGRGREFFAELRYHAR